MPAIPDPASPNELRRECLNHFKRGMGYRATAKAAGLKESAVRDYNRRYKKGDLGWAERGPNHDTYRLVHIHDEKSEAGPGQPSIESSVHIIVRKREQDAACSHTAQRMDNSIIICCRTSFPW